MPVTRTQAKELCTKPEYELVEASFRPAITALSAARLRSKVARARQLQDKYRDLAQAQNRQTKETRPDRGRGSVNLRTERKAQLFAETRERFEKRLAEVEAKETEGAGAKSPRGGARSRSARATTDQRRERRRTKQALGSEASRRRPSP